MAINIIDQPGTTAPIGNTDYTQQNKLALAALAMNDEILTDWGTVLAEPLIEQGTYIFHSGNTYLVESADEPVSGTPAAGINYLILTPSGDTLVASWAQSLSGYAYNPAFKGMYNGTSMAHRSMLYLDGTDYRRGKFLDRALSGGIMLASGTIVASNSISAVGTNLSIQKNTSITGSLTASGAASFLSLTSSGAITYSSGHLLYSQNLGSFSGAFPYQTVATIPEPSLIFFHYDISTAAGSPVVGTPVSTMVAYRFGASVASQTIILLDFVGQGVGSTMSARVVNDGNLQLTTTISGAGSLNVSIRISVLRQP